ncbi:MAG TPA: glycerate kinase [Gaiellaceae bacterium]|jgi:glycerate kinase|nr:glycerate kinase [Gaiellaceae bacterium]
MPNARALACPASLKGVLSARDAAAALAEGLRSWAEVDELPVADGGEGTLDVLHASLGGEWRDAVVPDAFGRSRVARWLELPSGASVVESAEAIPLDQERLDPFAASSRGLGELIRAVGHPRELLVCLGGTANVDGGAGLLEVLDELPARTRVACDVDVPLVDAARLFSAQKGASPADADELEARLVAMAELAPYAHVPGAGAAGGLGAALASLGAELLPGAPLVLDLVGFDATGYDLVITGEGTVDGTTIRGKAPGEVARRCVAAGVRCIVFGGRVAETPPELETIPLSGDPSRATNDLVALGRLLREAKAE